MWEKLLPRAASNDYRGRPLAKWALVPLTLITIGRSLTHMFAEDGGAQSIATIPLADFTANGANAVITIFALWGLSQLIIGLLYALVWWRYAALIPLVYLLFTGEYLMRLLAGLYTPGIETASTPPGAIGDYLFVPLGIVLLALSLREGPDRA